MNGDRSQTSRPGGSNALKHRSSNTQTPAAERINVCPSGAIPGAIISQLHLLHGKKFANFGLQPIESPKGQFNILQRRVFARRTIRMGN